MSNQRIHLFACGKKVYWVNGNRFYNEKTTHNGYHKAVEYCLSNFIDTKNIVQFDSDTECDYYEVLLAKQSKGEISNLCHHYLLRVQDEFINSNGDTIPEITYNADFIYKDLTTNKRVVVDVKSSEYFLSNDGGRFILLKSVFDKIFKDKDLYIQIIIKKSGEFYEWHIGDKKKSQKMIIKQREQLKTLKQEKHQNEVAERKKEREIKRLNELRNLASLTKTQLERLNELERKYKV